MNEDAIIFQIRKFQDNEWAEGKQVTWVLHVTKMKHNVHHILSLLCSFALDVILSLFVLH